MKRGFHDASGGAGGGDTVPLDDGGDGAVAVASFADGTGKAVMEPTVLDPEFRSVAYKRVRRRTVEEDEDEDEFGGGGIKPGDKELKELFECKARNVQNVAVIRANHASRLRDQWLEAQIARLNSDPTKAPSSGFMAESTDDEQSNSGLPKRAAAAMVASGKKASSSASPEEEIEGLFAGPLTGLRETLETTSIVDRWRVLAMLRFVASRLSDSMQDDLVGARKMEEALTADYMASRFVAAPKMGCIACLFDQCVPPSKPGVAPSELQATHAMMKARMTLQKRDIQLQVVLATAMFNSTVLPVIKSVRTGLLGSINALRPDPLFMVVDEADMATHMKMHMPENRGLALHLSMIQDNARVMAAIHGYGMGFRDKATGAVSVNFPAVRTMLSLQTQNMRIEEAKSREEARLRALDEKLRSAMPPPSSSGAMATAPGVPRRKQQGRGVGNKLKRRGR